MYFPLWANLRLFKFIPDEFVLNFYCFRQKVSRTVSGRLAGCYVKKAMRTTTAGWQYAPAHALAAAFLYQY
jgi:hypothetical protein